jgi:hypothetical protein
MNQRKPIMMHASNHTTAHAMRTLPACLFVIVAWLLGGTHAQAKRLTPFRVFYDTDFLSAGVGGLRDYGYGKIQLTNLTGSVTKAYLYWQGPAVTAGTNGLANSVVQINNQTVVGTAIGLGSDICWNTQGAGYSLSLAYRADVTSLVANIGNGPYFLNNFMRPLGTNSRAINVNGASLMVFYHDGNSENNHDVILLDGNDSSNPSPFPSTSADYDEPGWSFTVTNFTYQFGAASIELHVSDGQYFEPLDDGPLQIGSAGATILLESQGHIFSGDTNYMPAANNGPTGNGCLWDIKAWRIDPYLTNGQSTFYVTNKFGLADCTSLVAAAILLPKGAVDGPSVIRRTGLEEGGGVRLNFTGKNERAYSVLGSSNLVDWSVLGMATSLSNGLFQFLDSETPRPRQRFYQIRSP